MTARETEAGTARLIVRAGGKRFALPAAAVREIAMVPRLATVPLAPPALLGLGAVRGETLAILSLARLADAHPRNAPERAARHVLVMDGTTRAALAIDRLERIDRGGAALAHSGDALLDIDQLIADALPLRPASRRAPVGATGGTGASGEDDRLALLRFSVAGQAFALPLSEIPEVLGVPADIAALPGAAKSAVGSIAWSGSTLGVLSLGALLGLPSAPGAADRSRRIIVTELGGHNVGLLVDRVDTVLRAPPDRIDPVPPGLSRSDGPAWINALYRPATGGQLVSILALDRLLGDNPDKGMRGTTGQRPAGGGATAAAAALEPILPITIGSARLAFRLGTIAQVTARPDRITRVPGAPGWLSGIAMVGGAPCAIIDQVLRLTGTPIAGARQRLLMIEGAGTRIGFLVTGTGRVIRADPSLLAPAPLPTSLAGGIFGEALRLCDKDDGEADAMPMLLIDPNALVSSLEQAVIATLPALRVPGSA